jgi:glycosyltransferase involved in cell wall biosynthesis
VASTPVFSVVTPVYNGAAFIRRCFAMLAGQSFTDWEWVVVDDGSTDGTAQIVRELDDARIRLLAHAPNRGRGYARQAALAAARGDWMVVWDADDLYFPDRLEKISQARAEGYDFFCSYAVVVDNALRVKGVRGFHPAARGLPRHFMHHTLGCRMEIARSVGYDPALRTGEDATITWVLDGKYRGRFLDDALTIYQEEREVNLAKALATNAAQARQLRRAVAGGLLSMPRADYRTLLARLLAKRAVLAAMQLAPALYRLTVPLRSYGATAPGYALPAARVEFIERLRRDWPAAAA